MSEIDIRKIRPDGDNCYMTPLGGYVNVEDYYICVEGSIESTFVNSLEHAAELSNIHGFTDTDLAILSSVFAHARLGISVIGYEKLEAKIQSLMDKPVNSHFVIKSSAVKKHYTESWNQYVTFMIGMEDE